MLSPAKAAVPALCACWLFTVLGLPVGLAQAQDVDAWPAPQVVETLAPLPEGASQREWPQRTAQWRDYFFAARAADALGDPYQRCVAWPALPGTGWHPRQVQALCETSTGRGLEALRLTAVRARLDAGDLAGVEAEMDALLARHHGVDVPSELLHTAVGHFDNGDELTDRLTRDWLRQAPESGWAWLARGRHLANRAWNARGFARARDTSAAQFAESRRLGESAVEHYRQALQRNPKLMDAYAGQVELGRMLSSDELKQRAYTAASAIDPGCLHEAVARLRSLQPRWGGSPEELLSLAAHYKPMVGPRPELAEAVAYPYAHIGYWQVAEDEVDAQTLQILETAVSTAAAAWTLDSLAQVNQMQALDASDPDASFRRNWRTMALAMQALRFDPAHDWSLRWTADWMREVDRDWAAWLISRGAAAQPHDASWRMALGIIHVQAGRFDAARPELELAATDPNRRTAALRALVHARLLEAAHTKQVELARAAASDLERLRQHAPDDPNLLLLDFTRRTLLTKRADVAELGRVVAGAERTAPLLRVWLDMYRTAHEFMQREGKGSDSLTLDLYGR